MIINIDLSTKSLNKAIKQLQKVEKTINDKMVREYLLECSRAIIDLANHWLSIIDIGEDVRDEIISGWRKPVYNKMLKNVVITNTSDEAVYIEFGTGIVGQESPHPRADIENYKYDMREKGKNFKDADGMWIFKVEEDSKVDVLDNYIITRTTHTISTKGMPAMLFVYNAIQVFIDTKRYQIIWENVKRKYFN